MKYDEIIEDVGGCGLYQKLILILVYGVLVLDGLQIGSYVFIVPKIQHRCAIPSLPNDTYEVQDTNHADLIETYIPQHMEEGISEYSSCYLYSNETVGHNRTTYKCNSWVYDKSVYQTSVVSDMNLVCSQEMFASHTKTAFFVGALIMFLIGGWISDRFGRKITIVSCVLIQGISSLISSQVTNIYLFLFLRVLSAIGGAGSFGAAIVFVTEITSKKYRSRPSLLIQIAFPVAFLLISLVAYCIRYWEVLMIVISVPSLPLALLILWLMPESPRWLMSIKKKKQAGKIFNKMAKINKRDFIYKSEEEVEVSVNNNDRSVKLWKIFTIPSLLKKTLIMMFNWSTTIFVYYGLTLNIGVLAGNVYLNLVLNALLEIPAILFAILLVERIGRRKLSIFFMILAGLSGILTIFPYLYASKDHYSVITGLITFSRMCVSGATSIIYLYSCELYPTCIRNVSVGFFGAFCRIAGSMSSYVMHMSNLAPGRLGESLPLLVMGSLCFASGVLYGFLPETTNKAMLDTLDDVMKSEYTANSVASEDEKNETVGLKAVAEKEEQVNKC